MEGKVWHIKILLFYFTFCSCTQQPPLEGNIFKYYYNENQNEIENHLNDKEYPSEVADYAMYLLNHSILHGSFCVEDKLFSKAMKYKSYSSHQLYLMGSKLQSELATSYYSASNWRPDREFITLSTILEHVNFSQKVKNMPWNNYLSDESFKQYILPYRAHKEPLDSTWRNYFHQELLPLVDTFTQNSDPVAVCSFVNTHLGKKYGLRRIKEKISGELSFRQINQLEGGMCEELTNITTYAMRSIGLPVVRDFTPAWAKKAHFGHHWLALVLENDTTLAFDAVYRNPERGKNKPSRIAAKVYRFNFQANLEKLEIITAAANQQPNLEFTASPYITDVTPLYYETINLGLPIPSKDSNAAHYSLGVFNYGQWKPVDYGHINFSNDSLIFKYINRDIIYILLRFQGNEWLPTGDPFLVDSSGVTHYMTPVPEKLKEICLNKWFDWEEKQIADSDSLKLEYWGENNWRAIQDMIKPSNGQICVDSVPSNALLRLTNYRGRPYYMRPFILINSNQPSFY